MLYYFPLLLLLLVELTLALKIAISTRNKAKTAPLYVLSRRQAGYMADQKVTDITLQHCNLKA